MIFWMVLGGSIAAVWCVIGVLLFVYRNRVPEEPEDRSGENGDGQGGSGGANLCSWTG